MTDSPCPTRPCWFTGSVSNNTQLALLSSSQQSTASDLSHHSASQSSGLTLDEAGQDSAHQSPLDTAERPPESAEQGSHTDMPTTGLLCVNPARPASPALPKTRLEAAAAQLAMDSQFQTPRRKVSSHLRLTHGPQCTHLLCRCMPCSASESDLLAAF